MYYAILGRQSEAEGLAFWTNLLDTSKISRAQLVNAFLRSLEGTNRVLNSYYSSYLKREIDSGAQAFFVSQLQAGKTFGAVAASILASDEVLLFAGKNL
jgi:hypothetical protein